MTVSPRRLVALSLALTLGSAPLASAQSPAPRQNPAPSKETTLLSKAAFGRLVQSPHTDAPQRVIVVKDLPRLDLRGLMTAPAGWRQPVSSASAPQRNWASRHKGLILTIIGVGVGFLVAMPFLLCDDEC